MNQQAIPAIVYGKTYHMPRTKVIMDDLIALSDDDDRFRTINSDNFDNLSLDNFVYFRLKGEQFEQVVPLTNYKVTCMGLLFDGSGVNVLNQLDFVPYFEGPLVVYHLVLEISVNVTKALWRKLIKAIFGSRLFNVQKVGFMIPRTEYEPMLSLCSPYFDFASYQMRDYLKKNKEHIYYALNGEHRKIQIPPMVAYLGSELARLDDEETSIHSDASTKTKSKLVNRNVRAVHTQGDFDFELKKQLCYKKCKPLVVNRNKTEGEANERLINEYIARIKKLENQSITVLRD